MLKTKTNPLFFFSFSPHLSQHALQPLHFLSSIVGTFLNAAFRSLQVCLAIPEFSGPKTHVIAQQKCHKLANSIFIFVLVAFRFCYVHVFYLFSIRSGGCGAVECIWCQIQQLYVKKLLICATLQNVYKSKNTATTLESFGRVGNVSKWIVYERPNLHSTHR